MHCGKAGLTLIEDFEGFRATRYWDTVGRVWTVGYGTTSAVVDPVPQSVTRAEAILLLQLDLKRSCEPAINALGLKLTQNQFDALCSFTYNLGAGILGPEHTIGADLRASNFAKVADDFPLYSDPGTIDHEGLLRRREAERELWLTPDPRPASYASYYLPSERRAVALYDRLIRHRKRNGIALRILHKRLRFLRNRVWQRAHRTAPPDWSTGHRGWRFQQLNRRYLGK